MPAKASVIKTNEKVLVSEKELAMKKAIEASSVVKMQRTLGPRRSEILPAMGPDIIIAREGIIKISPATFTGISFTSSR